MAYAELAVYSYLNEPSLPRSQLPGYSTGTGHGTDAGTGAGTMMVTALQKISPWAAKVPAGPTIRFRVLQFVVSTVRAFTNNGHETTTKLWCSLSRGRLRDWDARR